MKINFKVFSLCAVFLISAGSFFSQSSLRPSARFLFNDANGQDEISKASARLVGATFTEDRFGNPKSAVQITGHEFSYVNLGSGTALKPVSGSISFWVRLVREVYYGQGYRHNPLILTKNAPRDDFYEAYAIYLDLETKRLFATCSHDSASAPNVYLMEAVKFGDWYHLVLTYNDSLITLYANGKPVGSAIKQFRTRFDPMDSVMVGASANRKNNRFGFGVFDDIEFFDHVLNASQVQELYQAANPNRPRMIFKWIIIFVCCLAAVTAIYLFIRHRLSVIFKKEKEKLELANKLLENDLRINRALMNPHFIFNALNTLYNYILSNNTATARDYLIKFSKLIRTILESNLADTLTLEQEIELLERYLEIEKARFRDPVDFEISVVDLTPPYVTIPIMMVQPFVENALWHGLSLKTGEKILRVRFSREGDKYVRCVVEDNGIGRNRQTVSAGKKSLATNFVQQRLELLNRIHGLECTLDITDKPQGSGTFVSLLLPIISTEHKNTDSKADKGLIGVHKKTMP